jgi:glutamine amidotransferase-like uncharacterized protein
LQKGDSVDAAYRGPALRDFTIGLEEERNYMVAHKKGLTRRAAALTLLALSACNPPPSRNTPADILLFTGTGASPGDVTAIKKLLRRNTLSFATANTHDLNEMSPDRLRAYRLLIIPGGNFEVMGNNLTPAASSNIRASVEAGLNYLGVCAGAFYAGASPYNGANLTNGVRFNFYAISANGVRKASVPIATPDGQTLEHYWEDGPELSGWGEAIALYPDRTPAIVQGRAGEGWVVLTGIHPEADESWRRGLRFSTPAGAANDYATTLILAALNGERLAHF